MESPPKLDYSLRDRRASQAVIFSVIIFVNAGLPSLVFYLLRHFTSALPIVVYAVTSAVFALGLVQLPLRLFLLLRNQGQRSAVPADQSGALAVQKENPQWYEQVDVFQWEVCSNSCEKERDRERESATFLTILFISGFSVCLVLYLHCHFLHHFLLLQWHRWLLSLFGSCSLFARRSGQLASHWCLYSTSDWVSSTISIWFRSQRRNHSTSTLLHLGRPCCRRWRRRSCFSSSI